MEYLALYRKYRPSGFEGVIGQEHIIQTLTNQITNNRLGHAYLFTGTRGTGKTSVAKIFAKAVNCQTPVNGSPCGKCAACVALSDPSNIDILEMDAASNNGVNEIRDLIEKVQFPPTASRFKVYIIDEVHMLSTAAFNALLKTLEEPPKHAIFVLATTEVHKIPATILSRCMRFDFRLVSTEKIAELISNIYDLENKLYESEAVFAIAKAGEGSVRDALSIADMALSVGKDKLTYNDVLNVLGSTNVDILDKLVKAILESDTGNVLDTVNELVLLGKSIGVLVKDVSSVVRDLIVVKTCSNPNNILRLPDVRFSLLKRIADETTSNRLLRVLEIFTELNSNIRYSSNPRVIFEMAVLKASRPEVDGDLSALLARISLLEKNLANGDVVKKEVGVEKKVVKNIVSNIQKKNISDFSDDELKGKLLVGLRNIGSEMLWNVFQNVNVKTNGKILTINVSNESDYGLLQKQETIDKINQALIEFNNFETSVTLSQENLQLKEVDDATEKIKKIFGDDIVIIKD